MDYQSGPSVITWVFKIELLPDREQKQFRKIGSKKRDGYTLADLGDGGGYESRNVDRASRS